VTTKVKDVCQVRSKNAGPYWVTFDFFFDSPASYSRYAQSETLGPATFARLFGTEAGEVKSFLIDRLNILKVSYPRATPQGGIVERDMHRGQQFVRFSTSS